MKQPLPYDEIEVWHSRPDMNKLDEILNTSDDSNFDLFIELDLRYPDNIEEKTKNFQFCPQNKICNKNEYSDYMKKIKPDTYTQNKKLIFDWTDKKKYLILYRMLKFYVRHGMLVEKTHEKISFKKSKWWEKYKNFKTQKRNRAKNEFESDFYKLLNNFFYGKTMEYILNRLRLDFFLKCEGKKIIKRPAKKTFNGIYKSYENWDSYTSRQNEVLMDKPIYLGFAILELSKLHMYETYYDELQPYFETENLQLPYMVTDSCISSVNTEEDLKIIEEDLFDFGNKYKNHLRFS